MSNKTKHKQKSWIIISEKSCRFVINKKIKINKEFAKIDLLQKTKLLTERIPAWASDQTRPISNWTFDNGNRNC